MLMDPLSDIEINAFKVKLYIKKSTMLYIDNYAWDSAWILS